MVILLPYTRQQLIAGIFTFIYFENMKGTFRTPTNSFIHPEKVSIWRLLLNYLLSYNIPFKKEPRVYFWLVRCVPTLVIAQRTWKDGISSFLKQTFPHISGMLFMKNMKYFYLKRRECSFTRIFWCSFSEIVYLFPLMWLFVGKETFHRIITYFSQSFIMYTKLYALQQLPQPKLCICSFSRQKTGVKKLNTKKSESQSGKMKVYSTQHNFFRKLWYYATTTQKIIFFFQQATVTNSGGSSPILFFSNDKWSLIN